MDRTIIQIPNESDEFKALEKELRDSLISGSATYYMMQSAGKDVHANYVSSSVKSDPTNFKVKRISRIQNGHKLAKHRIDKDEAKRESKGEVKTMRVYHGTSEASAHKIPYEGFSRHKTHNDAYGKGTYFDPHGQIAIYHGLKANKNGKCFIIAGELAYHTFGRTTQRDIAPPRGTDCGSCCEADPRFKKPCIVSSFRDDQVLAEYIIELEWTGLPI